jgi:hypothetical protein
VPRLFYRLEVKAFAAGLSQRLVKLAAACYRQPQDEPEDHLHNAEMNRLAQMLWRCGAGRFSGGSHRAGWRPTPGG